MKVLRCAPPIAAGESVRLRGAWWRPTMSVCASRRRGRVRTAPRRVAATGYHLSLGAKVLGESSGLSEPATRFSLLKASLKNLAAASPRHMARAKASPKLMLG
jgi:hypothetical protein